METKIIDDKTIINSFREILNSLSKKEKDVIEKRVWFDWQRQTLQSIWNSFSPSITRERVRQIENSWIKKIWRIIKASVLSEIQNYRKEILNMHWWVITKDKLINAIIKWFNLPKETNSNIIEMIIESDYDIIKSKAKLWTKTHFFNPNVSKKTIENVYKERISILKKRKDVMDKNLLYEMIRVNLKLKESIVFIDSVMDIYEDIIKWEENLIWLTSWRILNPKTLKDKAIYVLKKEKIPMHFVSIANKISDVLQENVKVNTVHNELIRNPEFVLVGRGIYALKDWWIYKPGTVIDVIVDILKKSSEPLTKEEIISKVLKVRKVKPSTIYMNLQNKNIIQRVWRNYYTLKNAN